MIKTYNGSKLGVTSSHRKAMLRNIATELFLHEKITTTLPKAKEVISYAEKIITKAKKGDLSAIRGVSAEIHNKEVVKKIFDVLAPRYKERNGGYIQIIKAGVRRGDAAKEAIVKFVI
ncbi:50S ribosomal protein L17 [Endomicrobium proavitum]|uniref:Large ribosomal subunit protein bL17 n=1 Tax=Endomicrobium proavitum TaxID=1408281 RepID=A0A0G3WK68_9BACT|nr:50S ribosomal protein L17 [Endomicrobium proavitum]AKL98698.1 50S ribosomal subunit protein L17 [Endomicrobium proavitum]